MVIKLACMFSELQLCLQIYGFCLAQHIFMTAAYFRSVFIGSLRCHYVLVLTDFHGVSKADVLLKECKYSDPVPHPHSFPPPSLNNLVSGYLQWLFKAPAHQNYIRKNKMLYICCCYYCGRLKGVYLALHVTGLKLLLIQIERRKKTAQQNQ